MENRGKRIVFAGGGTGGHLFPALSVADELRRRNPGARISFIGARRGLESSVVPQAGYPLRALSLSGLKGRGITGRIAAAVAAAWAVVRCVAWFLRRRPHLVIGVGGYASGPGVLAGSLLKIKTMVMEQNHFPGATNRWLSSRVDAVCVPSDAANRRMGGIGIVTGNPVRPEFFEAPAPPAGPALSLLVFGGSRGARSINRAMTEALKILGALESPPRIVHQTGTADAAAVREAYRHYPPDRALVVNFIDDMPARLAAADLVVCRAGASTLAELAAAGRPAILVPYPFAADDHQQHNAVVLQSIGAAEIVSDDELDGDRLAGLVSELSADPQRRQAMGRAARTLAVPDAAGRIAQVAESLIAGRPAGGARVS